MMSSITLEGLINPKSVSKANEAFARMLPKHFYVFPNSLLTFGTKKSVELISSSTKSVRP